MTPELFRWILFTVVSVGLVGAVYMHLVDPTILIAIITYLMKSPRDT